MSKKLKAMGLALIVVCAFGTASASASAAQFTATGVASGSTAAIATSTVPSGTLTLTVKNLLRITCSTLTVNGGTVTVGTVNGSATSLAFGGCTVDNSAGTAQPVCSVKNAGGTAGTIKTVALTSKLVTDGTVAAVTFTPTTGTSFVEIEVTGAECALATTAKVTGTAVAKITSPASGTLATTVTLEASQAISETFGDKLLFGARESWLDGEVGLHLVSDGNWGYDL